MAEFVWKRGHTVAAIAVGVVVLGGGTATALSLGHGAEGPAAPPSVAASGPTPTTSSTSPSPKPGPSDFLTGGAVSTNEVVAVKVENIAAARPQVGLRSADIVFVEEVEG